MKSKASRDECRRSVVQIMRALASRTKDPSRVVAAMNCVGLQDFFHNGDLTNEEFIAHCTSVLSKLSVVVDAVTDDISLELARVLDALVSIAQVLGVELDVVLEKFSDVGDTDARELAIDSMRWLLASVSAVGPKPSSN